MKPTGAEAANAPPFEWMQARAWMLRPEALDEVEATLLGALNGSVSLIRGPARADDEPAGYSVHDGVGFVPVHGTLMKSAGFMSWLFGGTTYAGIEAAIAAALADPTVDAIVLDVDSPGGSADGVTELARWLAEQRGPKPIVAHANGMMASAAYYLASAADEIVANESALVGSIGVRMTHYDFSKEDEKWGLKRTEIYAGEYKAAGNDGAPLDDKGRAYLQGLVDDYYKLFVDDVAAHRAMPAQQILDTEARVYLGQKALDVGLVDRIGNREDAFQRAVERSGRMDRTELKQKHPEIYDAVYTEGFTAAEEAAKGQIEAAGEAATVAERARAVKILTADGDPDVTKKAIEDGTEPGAFFEAALAAEKAKRDQGLEDLGDGLDDPAQPAGQEKGDEGHDFMALVNEYQKANQSTRTQALSAIAAQHPEAHKAFLAGRN